MKLGRKQMAGLALAAAGLAVLGGCNRRKGAEVNAIVPSVAVNRAKAPLGSAIEVTYTWTVEPTAKKLGQDYRALVHFLDSHGVLLFGDDHAPTPAPTSWEAGKTYSYTRTVFVPVYPYVGPVQVVMGLYPAGGKGERPALKGEDRGLREYVVGKMEFLPQTDNIFLVYKEGWHNPESAPHNPSLERTWTKKDALVSFKNPKKDIVVYLEADTNAKAFDAPPVLTLAVANKSGLTVPIENSEVFLRKVRVKAADLGSDEWVDLKLSMSESFVPKAKGVNTHDDRELGLMVYHLYVGEADALGTVPQVVDAGPLTPGAMAAGATPSKTTPAPKPPVKPAAGPAASR
jgi:hypothetical protein